MTAVGNNKKTEETSVFFVFYFVLITSLPLAGAGAEMGTPAPTKGNYEKGELCIMGRKSNASSSAEPVGRSRRIPKYEVRVFIQGILRR